MVANDELAEFLEKRRKELSAKDSALAVQAVQFFYTQSLGRVWHGANQAQRGTDLRQRMLHDMLLRNLAPKTQQEYLR